MINNFFLKLWYKIFNIKKYQNLKEKKRTATKVKYYNSHIYKQIINFEKKIEKKKELSFLHSGQLGDLIYSLATIKELSHTHKCKLFVQVNKPMPPTYTDTEKKYLISSRAGNLILPLLKSQNFLDTVSIYNGEEIDINLDLFREVPINLSFYSTRWFAHLVGVNINVENTFLTAEPHSLIKNKIVIHRSPRYRNAYINYKFLNNVENLLCIGLKSEFDDLKKEITNLQFHDCKDFLEMAQIIAASKFYIGNMSFQYILSEGLKIPRLLEASPDFPVVFPVGTKAFDAYHQNHFEKFFNKLNQS